MNERPIILVLSETDSLTPQEIIANIRKLPQDTNCDEIGSEFVGCNYEIVTKYYTTTIYLTPLEVPLADFMQSSPVIASRVEGILVYFDAKKRAFLDSIPRYGEFLKNHNIECGILLCDRLPEDECDGITYREAKTQGMALDLIELHPENEDESCDSPEEASFLEPIGYDELAKALRSYIWSNVENVTNVHNSSSVIADDHSIEALISQIANNSLLEDESAETMNEDDIEEELSVFEKILTELLQFQGNTANSLNRSEKLAYAQEVAESLDQIIDKDRPTADSDSD